MVALSEREMLTAFVAGLILGGLLLLRILSALVSPELPQVTPTSSEHWTHRFRTRRALGSLALTVAFLGMTAIVVGGAIGVRGSMPQPGPVTSVSAVASTVETASAVEAIPPPDADGQ